MCKCNKRCKSHGSRKFPFRLFSISHRCNKLGPSFCVKWNQCQGAAGSVPIPPKKPLENVIFPLDSPLVSSFERLRFMERVSKVAADHPRSSCRCHAMHDCHSHVPNHPLGRTTSTWMDLVQSGGQIRKDKYKKSHRTCDSSLSNGRKTGLLSPSGQEEAAQPGKVTEFAQAITSSFMPCLSDPNKFQMNRSL